MDRFRKPAQRVTVVGSSNLPLSASKPRTPRGVGVFSWHRAEGRGVGPPADPRGSGVTSARRGRGRVGERQGPGRSAATAAQARRLTTTQPHATHIPPTRRRHAIRRVSDVLEGRAVARVHRHHVGTPILQEVLARLERAVGRRVIGPPRAPRQGVAEAVEPEIVDVTQNHTINIRRLASACKPSRVIDVPLLHGVVRASVGGNVPPTLVEVLLVVATATACDEIQLDALTPEDTEAQTVVVILGYGMVRPGSSVQIPTSISRPNAMYLASPSPPIPGTTLNHGATIRGTQSSHTLALEHHIL